MAEGENAAGPTCGARRLLSVIAVFALAVTLLIPAGSASAAVGGDRDAYEAPVARVLRAPPTGVVSLGDSYSSGLGIGEYDDECDRTEHAWGRLIFADDIPAEDRLLLACSGADIADVYDQLDELRATAGGGGRMITLTVGGNDIGYAGELTNCYLSWSSCTPREGALMAEIRALVEPLTELYLAVQAAAPHDVLVVGGYPLLVPDPDARGSCRALTPLLSASERQMIRRLGVALNQAIADAAAAAGVRSAGTELVELFDGHEACANGPDDWLNGLTLGWPSGPETARIGDSRWGIAAAAVRDSFHPNMDGHRGYAEAFTQAWANG